MLDLFVEKSIIMMKKNIDKNIESKDNADDIIFNLKFPKGEYSRIRPEQLLVHRNIIGFKYKGYILLYLGDYNFKLIKPIPEIMINQENYMSKVMTVCRKQVPLRLVEIIKDDGSKIYQNIDTGREYDKSFFDTNFEQYGSNYIEIASILVEQYISTIKLIPDKQLYMTIEVVIKNIFVKLNNRYPDIDFDKIIIDQKIEGLQYICKISGRLFNNDFEMTLNKRIK